jgi:L-ascorbate metabolism protein UlaG (beta-lactamase superfamily)
MTLWIILSLCGALTITSIGLVNPTSIGKLPSGARLERIEKSPHYKDGAFQNEFETQTMTSDKGFWNAMYDFLLKSYPNTIPDSVPAIRTDLKKLDPNADWLVWFGHSSYLMQLSGKRILVDPVFYKASPVSFINRAFRGTDIYRPSDMPEIDYLIITHDHWDHLDYQTVKELRTHVKQVICGLGVGADFEYWGYDSSQITEMDWGDSVTIGGFTFYCLPARHFSGRWLSRNQTLWASFLLQTPVRKIYIGGDGGYDNRFKRLGEQFPGIDLAILENGQYNKNWSKIHLMPAELEQAARDIHAKKYMTVHHSKYKISTHAWDDPLKNEQKLREDSLDVLSPEIGAVVPLQ